MHRVAGLIALLGLLLIGNFPASASSDQQQEQGQKKSPPKKKADSMTGCIDEQAGRYVLLNERSRDVIADLEAEGFRTESFAKHVGQKVTVRGTANPGDNRPLFRVRSIETVSETCEP